MVNGSFRYQATDHLGLYFRIINTAQPQAWIASLNHTQKLTQCIKELNIRAKTMKPLEENIEGKFCDIGFCSDFLDITPKTQATKEKDK